LNNVYILSAVRTPSASLGARSPRSPRRHGVVAAKAALERAGVEPQQVEETSSAMPQAGADPIRAPNFDPKRRSSGSSRLHVNKACASGIKSIALGFQEIATGIWIASAAAPNRCRGSLIISRVRWGYRLATRSSSTHVPRRIFLSFGQDADGRDRRDSRRAVQDHGRARSVALVSQQHAATRNPAVASMRKSLPSDRRQEGNNVFSRDEHLFLDATPRRCEVIAVFPNRHDYCRNSPHHRWRAAVVLASEKFSSETI